MFAVLVAFNYADDFDRNRVEQIAHAAEDMFRGMPALRLKCFTVDEASRRAMNFYVWESRTAAEKFFTDDLRERVTQLYGVPPIITFLDIVEIVDNACPGLSVTPVGAS